MAVMYRRATRLAELRALSTSVQNALLEHAQQHQLRLENVRVWSTHSENPPAEGFFGKLFSSRANPADPDVAHDTIVVLHPTHLLVATAGEKRGTTVLSLPLAQASLTRGSALAARMPGAFVPGMNDGVTVTGFPGQLGRPGSYFIGLGQDPAGNDCAAALEAAIVAAKNPP